MNADYQTWANAPTMSFDEMLARVADNTLTEAVNIGGVGEIAQAIKDKVDRERATSIFWKVRKMGRPTIMLRDYLECYGYESTTPLVYDPKTRHVRREMIIRPIKQTETATA